MKKRLLLLSLALLACLALSAPAWAVHNVSDESDFRMRLENTGAGEYEVLTLQNNITISDYLVVQEGAAVTVKLNGYTIDRGLAGQNAVANGYVFLVKGTLQLSGTGSVTGGNNTGNGGGVYVEPSGSFMINGGIISGSTATTNGGGVFVFHSSYNVSGGKIINNLSGSSGGGGIAISDASTFIVGGTALVDTSNKAGNIEQVYGWATGATIVELSSQSDALNATVSSPAQSNNARLVAASYDASGKMVAAKTVSLGTAALNRRDFNTGLAVSAGLTYKVMLLDGATFAPLCPAWSGGF